MASEKTKHSNSQKPRKLHPDANNHTFIITKKIPCELAGSTPVGNVFKTQASMPLPLLPLKYKALQQQGPNHDLCLTVTFHIAPLALSLHSWGNNTYYSFPFISILFTNAPRRCHIFLTQESIYTFLKSPKAHQILYSIYNCLCFHHRM